MKKFIQINLFLMIIYFISNFAFNWYLTEYLEVQYLGEFENYDLSNEPYDYVNVGTSHGSVSFDWKTHDINGLNLGSSGQPLVQDQFLLKQHENYLDNDVKVIVPISFHTFCMDQNLLPGAETIYNDSIRLLGMVRTDWVLRYLINNENKSYPSDSFDFDRFNPNAIKPAECSEDQVQTSMNIINEIINEYENVILVTTPYYVESLSEIEYFNQFYSNINQIITTHNVNYFDYSRDERFNDTKYFYNNSHLNTLGRDKFTEYFYNEVLSPTN